MPRRSSAVAKATGPVNVPGAKRVHARLRVVRAPRPEANYEIVHGTVLLQDPDKAPGKGNFVSYFPGEVIRLSGEDAERMLASGVIVPVGEEAVLKTTMPDRQKAYLDLANHGKEPEGTAKIVVVDIEAAALSMYEVDSARPNMGGLNGSGR